MGCTCPTGFGVQDKRPKLKVTVVSADHLPRLDGNRPEIDAYAELRYGPAKKMAAGDYRGATTRKTKIAKTNHLSAVWNDVVYFPAPSLTAHYSLEISVWDKDVVGNDLGGTSMIQYSDRHTKNIDANAIVLPKSWNEESEYTLQLESKDDGSQAGKITIRCEFVNDKAGDETPLINK